MHKTVKVLCLLSALWPGWGSAQHRIAAILDQPHREVAVYDTTKFGRYQLALRFDYGSPTIRNADEYERIRKTGKVAVEYVYTQYARSQPLQRKLDEARFAALQKLAPDLFSDPYIRWDIIAQSAGTSREEAEGLFHGIVITYQPPIDSARIAEIDEKLSRAVDCARKIPPPDAAQYPGGEDALRAWLEDNLPTPTPAETSGDRGKVQYMLQFMVDTNGRVVKATLPSGTHAAFKKRVAEALKDMPVWLPGNPSVRFMLLLRYEPDKTHGGRKLQLGPLRGIDVKRCKNTDPEGEPIVTEVLKRNPHWKNMLVVEDVTGSMLPYVADLLVWNALGNNMQNVKHFVFFNDGDSKSTSEKVIGKTGGIYHSNARRLEDIEKVMVTAMSAGNGGDTPENDIEAILEGIKACPSCDEVILIADNNATPRDLALLDQVTKPVRVVLCGVRFAPNPAHIYIAWKTKGSLHTIDQDITELATLQEGEVIRVLDVPYKLKDGKIVKLSRE